MMRRAVIVLACAMAMACSAAAPRDKPRGEPAAAGPLPAAAIVALRNAGFEAPPRADARCPEGWSCTMHNDPDSFRFALVSSGAAEGKQALCVERVRDEPWALVTQMKQDAALRNQRLRFSIAVRIERLEGPGAGPWYVVHGPSGNLAHAERLVAKGPDWQRLSVEFDVPPAGQMVEVGAILQGNGRACFDDARLDNVTPKTPAR